MLITRQSDHIDHFHSLIFTFFFADTAYFQAIGHVTQYIAMAQKPAVLKDHGNLRTPQLLQLFFIIFGNVLAIDQNFALCRLMQHIKAAYDS